MHEDQLLVLLLILLLLLLPPRSFSIAIDNNQCTISCGEVANISYPFRLRGDLTIYGDPNYGLACVNNRTVLDLCTGKYYVRSIDYSNYTIWVADIGLQKGNCLSLPLRSLSCGYFSNKPDRYRCWGYMFYGRELSKIVSIVNCAKAIASRFYIDASSCLNGVKFSNFLSTRRQLYAMVDVNVSYVETACTIEVMAMIPGWVDGADLRSYAQIHEQMVYGFELSWLPIAAKMHCKNHYYWDFIDRHQIRCGPKRNIIVPVLGYIASYGVFFPYYGIEGFVVVKFIFGSPCVMLLLIRKWKRRHLAVDQNLEEFLQSNNKFLLIMYSYLDIKKITSGLKNKLGERGYGSVFKGRLQSGHNVVGKILKKGKANGKGFISEVATIGRIHYINVVGLVGFCFEGSKQALVYDFMSNRSLDKHIFSQGEGISLECKEVYEIALEVARGIEYLYQGYDMQILHLDIKHHNIFLGKDFSPKFFDFGLARLYPTNYNTVSLTAARETFGYMASELVFKNLGGVSYKADVYTFGKLLMEMASRRKNGDLVSKYSSQIYFPLWVHDQLSEGLDVPVEVVSERRGEQ